MIQQEIDEFKSQLVTPVPAPISKHFVEFLFKIPLKVSCSEIWPYLSDTSKMNKEMGFHPRAEKEVGGELHVTTKTLGKNEHWIEKPWVWVSEKELQNHRIFFKGWMTEHRGIFTTAPTSTGCDVYIYFRWCFSNVFYKKFFSIVGPALKKNMDKFFLDKEKIILDERASTKNDPPEVLEGTPREKLQKYFMTSDDLDLDRIHLKALSRNLKIPLPKVIDDCHQMVSEGLLTFSWDVVCPHCRGVRGEHPDLASLNSINTCEACDVEFTLDEEEAVEVVFHLTPKIRTIPKMVYCSAEPARKSHIKLNQILLPQGPRSVELNLKKGIYRLRAKELNTSIYLEVSETSEVQQLTWEGKPRKQETVGPKFTLKLENPTQDKLVYTLEEAWWFEDRLTPKEVLSHPSMRNLFSEDHMKVGVKLNVGKQVILFTDIVGSTPLYKEHGDAKALKVVQEHYVEVTDLIKKHHGAVVKYIGDAVMAAFLDINDAFKCSIAIHAKFPAHRSDTPIRLRASLHQGTVLCANLNVGLDYFGTTVNQSAKIQKWANAFEIAMSEEDWKKLQPNFPEITSMKDVIHDEKLEMDVRVILSQ